MFIPMRTIVCYDLRHPSPPLGYDATMMMRIVYCVSILTRSKDDNNNNNK